MLLSASAEVEVDAMWEGGLRRDEHDEYSWVSNFSLGCLTGGGVGILGYNELHMFDGVVASDILER